MEHRSTAGKFLPIWGGALFGKVLEHFPNIPAPIETAIALMNPFIDPSDSYQVEMLVAIFERRGWSLGSLKLGELTSDSATMIVWSFEPSEDKDAVIAQLDAIKNRFCEANVRSGHFTADGCLWQPQHPGVITPNPNPPEAWQTLGRSGPDSLYNPRRRWGRVGGSRPRPVDTPWEDCADHKHGG